MKLLAIDTATEACSAALWLDGDIQQSYTVAPQQHAKLLLPMVDTLLNSAGLSVSMLDGLVFGRGPGSFTGVRIAAAAIQAMALATDCGVIGVSTLQALAHRAWREHQVTQCLAAIDARMQQVYWGRYVTSGSGDTRLVGHEHVSNPDQLDVSGLSGADVWIGAGSGALRYVDDFQRAGVRTQAKLGELFPAAIDMLHLAAPGFERGDAVAAEYAIPVYLRDKVALTERERASDD